MKITIEATPKEMTELLHNMPAQPTFSADDLNPYSHSIQAYEQMKAYKP